jgi:hypothetical protein
MRLPQRGGQHAKRLQEKQALASFRSCFIIQPTARILCKRRASDDSYPLNFLPSGSESVPPKLLETTSARIFLDSFIQKNADSKRLDALIRMIHL